MRRDGPTGSMDAPTAPVALITVLRERLVILPDPIQCWDLAGLAIELPLMHSAG
jgi:hypothetical protein